MNFPLVPISVAKTHLKGPDLIWAEHQARSDGIRCSFNKQGRIWRLAVSSQGTDYLARSELSQLHFLKDLMILNDESSQVQPLPPDAELFFQSEFETLTMLRCLGLRGFIVTASTFVRIAKSNPSLEVLGLPNCGITDTVCFEIAKLKLLLNLNLENNDAITIKGLAAIGRELTELRTINLKGTGILSLPSESVFIAKPMILFA